MTPTLHAPRKKCSRCATLKPLSEYYESGDGRPRADCKACVRKVQQAHRRGLPKRPRREMPVYSSDCERCGRPFQTRSSRRQFCSSSCKHGVPAQRSHSEKALYLSVMAPCPVCAAWGPRARLEDHLLWDHGRIAR